MDLTTFINPSSSYFKQFPILNSWLERFEFKPSCKSLTLYPFKADWSLKTVSDVFKQYSNYSNQHKVTPVKNVDNWNELLNRNEAMSIVRILSGQPHFS